MVSFYMEGDIMKKLSVQQLYNINGGGIFRETYEDIRHFVNKNLRDLIRGIKDGWKSR